MNYLRSCTIAIISLLLIMVSCSSEVKAVKDGSSCSYVKYEGSAKIISITAAPASEYSCPDKPMKVIFEFTPVNISDRDKYRFSNFKDFKVRMSINDGANPSLAWIKRNKIETGKKFRCVRTEITTGTCTPVGFEFPELDLFPETGCK